MSQSEILRFSRPYDWETMDSAIRGPGCLVAEGLFSEEEAAELNREVDTYLDASPGAGLPDTNSEYDKLLGRRTVRLVGMIEKCPSTPSWIGQPEILAWVERYFDQIATSALLNSAELIQVEPGEREQVLHRDTASWPAVPRGEHPLQVGALAALDPCTVENGATRVAPGSWRWDGTRKPQPEELCRATMEPGDAFLYRGDVWHGAGANGTDTARRVLGLTYVVGWLRPAAYSLLEVSKERLRTLDPSIHQLLGLSMYDGLRLGGGVLGTYEYGDPAAWLED